jgi:hypothetical protein
MFNGLLQRGSSLTSAGQGSGFTVSSPGSPVRSFNAGTLPALPGGGGRGGAGVPVNRGYLPTGRGSTQMRLPATVNCWLHNEDLDSSGGAGALAASLAGGQRGCLLSGNDTLYNNKPANYLGYQYGDEESTLADADGYIAIGNKRRIWLGLEDVTDQGWTQGWFPTPLRLANQETIDVVAKSTGGGAEQHSCVHFMDQPELGAPWAIRPVGGGVTCIKVEQPTGTLVAATMSGFTDICGRTTAYSGSQRSIPNTETISGILYAVTPINNAGYSGVVIRNPTQERNLVLMGSAGRVAGGVGATNTQPMRYDLTQIFGGGLAFNASEPLLLGGFGVSTTAQTAVLEIELYGVGVDG